MNAANKYLVDLIKRQAEREEPLEEQGEDTLFVLMLLLCTLIGGFYVGAMLATTYMVWERL